MSVVSIPQVSDDEAQRIADLEELGVLLTKPESLYDAVTADLARIFDVPAAFITFFDRDTQYYKSEIGLPPQYMETRTEPREVSICAHVIDQNDLLVVEDLQKDERFRDLPGVREDGVRFYAGAPLRADSGRAVGSLCVVDTKPRQVSERESQLLRMVAESVMLRVKLQRVTRSLLDRNKQLESDLEQAKTVQHHLLPPQSVQEPGWRFGYWYRPTAHLAGDFVDLVQRRDGRRAIIIADVSGHGTSAALTAMMTKIAFSRAAAIATPAAMLTSINAELADTTSPGQFMTALIALFDPESGEVTLASAGHPRPVLLDTTLIHEIDLRNEMPLLVEPDNEYRAQRTVTLQPGQRMLMYTDGAVELMDPSGGMLGFDGFEKFIRETLDGADGACLSKLGERMQHFAGQRPRDDITLVCIERM